LISQICFSSRIPWLPPSTNIKTVSSQSGYRYLGHLPHFPCFTFHGVPCHLHIWNALCHGHSPGPLFNSGILAGYFSSPLTHLPASTSLSSNPLATISSIIFSKTHLWYYHSFRFLPQLANEPLWSPLGLRALTWILRPLIVP